MKIIVLGIGKSGTTALLSGLAQGAGLPIAFEPLDLAHWEPPRDVVVKKLVDHLRPHEIPLLSAFDKRILLVRDPRDAIISRLLFMPVSDKQFCDDAHAASYLKLIQRKVERPTEISVQQVIETFKDITGLDLLALVTTVNSRAVRLYETAGTELYLCRYERMIAGERDDLAAYTGIRLPEKIEVDRKFRRVLRSGGSGEWRHWFTPSDQLFFDHFFAEFFQTFGYTPGPSADAPEIDEATTVGYVERMINQVRRHYQVKPFRFSRPPSPVSIKQRAKDIDWYIAQVFGAILRRLDFRFLCRLFWQAARIGPEVPDPREPQGKISRIGRVILATRQSMTMPIVPPGDFDEGAYLMTNKDVSAAVQRGIISSGFAHYIRHGYKENRRRPRPRATRRAP